MATTTERVPAASGVVWATSHRAAAEIRRCVVFVLVAAVACAAVITTYALAAPRDTVASRESATASAGNGVLTARDTGSAGNPAPSASEFALVLVGTTNEYAAAHGDPKRIADPDCVQGSVGRYMCSFVRQHPGGARECHVMQAKWTPDTASSFIVTLAGRAARCGSLREALLSLQ